MASKIRGKHARGANNGLADASENNDETAVLAPVDKAAGEESEHTEQHEKEATVALSDLAGDDAIANDAGETAALAAKPGEGAVQAVAAQSDALDQTVALPDAAAQAEMIPEPPAAPAMLQIPNMSATPQIIREEDPLAGFDVNAQGFPLNASGAAPDSFVPAPQVPSYKRRHALKAFGITCGVLIGVLLVAYVVGAVVFMGRFLPNSAVNGKDISLKTDAEVADVIEDMAASYQLDAIGGSFSYRTTAEQIGMDVDTNAIIKTMHDDQNPWAWPLLIIRQDHDETGVLKVDYDKAALTADLTEQIAKFNENATPPVNATIMYDEATKAFKVKPEEQGTQLNPDAVVAVITKAVPELQSKVVLDDEQRIQPTVFSNDQRLIDAAQIASGLVSADLTLVLDGQNVGEVNGEALSGFVTIDENFAVTFNEEGLNAWVEELASSYNTVGSERNYTRPDGKQISVRGGSYGWEIDVDALRDALIEGVKAGAKTQIEVPCISTAVAFRGAGSPDWGTRYLDVDLSEQYVRFYGDNGQIIWETACITGSPDGEHDTVPGVWYINNKESPSKLIGYEHGRKIYETMVQYWMAFEGNGIGFHDASWQPSFGGSMYSQGYGSHGCVNLPPAMAQSLYDICEIGDVVIVHS
ncbi:MAG TPA: hypothetical protein DCP91_04610 [Eggerthellaceae bacterium]|nr:hypothetical protein [Eggerthellaceae bacterium]